MQISFESNLREVQRGLSDAARRQLPFATSLALNAAAQEVLEVATRDLDAKLDKPTPFTKRAYRVRRSTRRNLEARVFAMRAQANYLSTLEDGGSRTPRRRALVLPQAARVNQYGNLPRGAIRRALAQSSTFSGTPKGGRGKPGIYKRQGRKLIKLVSYTPRARYSPRLGFRATAGRAALAAFPTHFTRAMVRAFATRR